MRGSRRGGAGVVDGLRTVRDRFVFLVCLTVVPVASIVGIVLIPVSGQEAVRAALGSGTTGVFVAEAGSWNTKWPYETEGRFVALGGSVELRDVTLHGPRLAAGERVDCIRPGSRREVYERGRWGYPAHLAVLWAVAALGLFGSFLAWWGRARGVWTLREAQSLWGERHHGLRRHPWPTDVTRRQRSRRRPRS